MKISKGEQTKLLITQEALKLFGEKGVLQTSIQEVADACGIKQTALLYHFSTKFILAENVIKYIARKNHTIVEAIIQNSKSSSCKIEAYWRGNIEWACSNRKEAGIILFLYYMASFDPEFASLYGQVRVIAQNRIMTYLEEEARNNPDYTFEILDIKTASGLVHESVIGGILHLITAIKEPTELDKNQLVDKWATMLRLLVK